MIYTRGMNGLSNVSRFSGRRHSRNTKPVPRMLVVRFHIVMLVYVINNNYQTHFPVRPNDKSFDRDQTGEECSSNTYTSTHKSNKLKKE